MNPLVRYLRSAVPAASHEEASDRELLARFAQHRDETAFALIVSRHGAAVWATCRRLLDREQDAEDAFQAVFLTLARKADSVGDCLSAWLHGVARRVAANVRRETTRRGASEAAARVPETQQPEMSWREGLGILDEELSRLPERYRAVLIACCLDGQSRDEAARSLGCTASQVKGMLERGRELLRQRLARRGIELGAVLLAASIASSNAAAVPSLSVEAAIQAAQGQAVSGFTPTAIALSERVVGAMFIQKVKVVAVLFLVVGLAAGAVLAHGAAGNDPVLPGVKPAPVPTKGTLYTPFVTKPTDPIPPLLVPPAKEEKPPVKQPDVMSIADAIKAPRDTIVKVEFVIDSVQSAFHTGFNAKEPRVILFIAKDPMVGGGKFEVLVGDKNATILFNLGLMKDTQATRGYFVKKTIRATGMVRTSEDPKQKVTNYQLILTDLENLEVVK